MAAGGADHLPAGPDAEADALQRSFTREVPALSRSTAGELPALTQAARGLALLFVEGLSLGFAVWAWRLGPRLVRYVTSNEINGRGRTLALASMFGAGALVAAVALFYLAVRRRTFATAARRVAGVAARLGPLALAGFVPLLTNWRLWEGGRELTFLALATIFGIGLQAMVRGALLAPPLGWWDRLRGVSGLAGAANDAAVSARARASAFWASHPRLGTRAPLAVVLLGAAGYAAFFGWATVVNHWNLRTASLDLGLEENLLWNAFHGARPLFKSSPLGGPHASHFGSHATIISYPLSYLYALAPSAEFLLILQAVLIGAAAVPLFLYARRHLGGWTACIVACAYLLYPPVHGANLYDFHYLPIGCFFLWMVLYALDARRTKLAAVMVLIALTVREDCAAGLALIGGYMLLSGQRPRGGLVVGAVGAIYFVTMKLIVMPHVLKGESSFVDMFKDLVPPGDRSFAGVLKTALGNPGYTMTTLLERDKLSYVLQLFAPLAFLPLRRPLGYFACVLGFFFTLLSTGYPPLLQTSFQYSFNWTPHLFVTVVASLVFVGRPRAAGDRQGWARRRAWVVAFAAAMLVCSYQFGAIFQRNTVRGGFGRYTFGTLPGDLERRAALKKLLVHVPPMAKIVASENLVPQVARRPDAYTLRVGTFDAEYLLFPIPVGGSELANALPLLQSNAFGVVEVQPPFVLARRGHSPAGNAAVIAQMH